MKISSLKKKEIIDLLSNHCSIHSALKSIDVYATGSGAYKTFNSRCGSLGIDPKIFLNRKKGYSIGKSPRLPLSEILVENSPYKGTSSLKKRLIKDGVLTYQCNECGISNWNGKAISLHLDHRNGINNDNRKENLRLLCPNCHSQTETYGGRNCKGQNRTNKEQNHCHCGTPINMRHSTCRACADAKKKSMSMKPSLEKLSDLLLTQSITDIGKNHGVSHTTVRRWINSYGLT